METSPFTRLSAELRNKIYTYALYNPEGIWLKHPRDDGELKPGWKLRLRASGNPTALAMTCRQLHGESGLLFYSINKFLVHLVPLHVKDCFGDWIWYPWKEEVKNWLDTIGPPNASCVTKLSLHVGDFHIDRDPGECLDSVVGILTSNRRALPDTLQLSLHLALSFFDMQSPSCTDHRWVPTSFELPLYDCSEAKRHIGLILDEKLMRLRELLKQVVAVLSRQSEEGIENAREQRPQALRSDDVKRAARSIRPIAHNIHNVKYWRWRFFGLLLEHHVPRLECAEVGIPEQSSYPSSDDSDSE